MKKHFKYLIIIVLTVGMVASCTSKKATVTAAASDEIADKYWKLVELNGLSISAEIAQTPYIMFNQSTGTVSSTGGCNQTMGNYTLDKAAKRVKITALVTTQKACMSENVDEQLSKVLQSVDNYSISADGKTLLLNRLRMAPLAVFELGELK
ncbi:MAG: META domain-containing protein [Prevotellaceae bacterium]|jgi:heat shock protein HslJ|nr:META domain-containing protein [Prevotellaceae bacterium]